MLQLVLVVIITFLIVTFGIANAHHVPLSFVLGAPVEIRLIFLLMCTFFMGVAVPVFHRLIQGLREDKNRKHQEKLQQAIQKVERDLVTK